MAKLDRSEVFITNLGLLRPTFHHSPDWLRGEGCNGPYHECNRNAFNGSTVELPDRVKAPCGETFMVFLVGGSDPDHRPDSERSSVLDNLVTNRGRMHFTHGLIGAQLPRGHAERFARPCKRCFPEAE